MSPSSSVNLSIVLKLVDDASSQLQAAGKKLGDLATSTDKANSTLKAFATTVIGLSTIHAIAGYALEAVNSFEEMNASVQRAGLAVGASSQQLNTFRDVVMQVASQTGASAQDVATALNSFAGGQISATVAAQNLGDVMKLKLIANMQDVQQASDLAANSLTVFASQGLSMTDVLDVISNVQKNVTSDTTSYADSLSHAEGTAKAAGFTFNDLNLILSAMVQGGTQVSDTWAGFNSAMQFVEKGSSGTKSALDAVGLSINDLRSSVQQGALPFLEYLKDGFDKANLSGQGYQFLVATIGAQAAGPFANALAQSNDQIQALAQSFTDAQGTGESYAQSLINAQPPMTQLKDAATNLQLAIGDQMDAAVKTGAGPLKDILTFLTDHVWIVDSLAAAIGVALIPVLYGLATALGIATTAAAAFEFVTAPWLLAIAAVGGGVALLASSMHQTAAATTAAIQPTGTLIDAWNNLGSAANTVKSTAPQAYLDLGSAASSAADKIQAANDAVANTQQKISDLQEALSGNIVDANTKEGEAIVAQQQKVADLKKQIGQSTSDIQRIQLLNQLNTEQAALNKYSQAAIDLSSQVAEAQRRAGETQFERTMEDIQNTEIGQVAAFAKQMTRLDQEMAKEQEKVKTVQTGEAAITKSVLDESQKQVDGVTDAVNKQISQYARLTSMLSFSGSMSGSTPALGGSVIPHLASGGIVSRPTIALIGEAGPEAVVPLSRGGFGGGITVNVTGNTISNQLDVRSIAQAVSDEIVRTLRMNGKYAI